MAVMNRGPRLRAQQGVGRPMVRGIVLAAGTTSLF